MSKKLCICMEMPPLACNTRLTKKKNMTDRCAPLSVCSLLLFIIGLFKHVDKFFPIKLVSAVQCVSLTPSLFCTRKAAPIQSDWHHGHGMLKSTFFPFSKEKRPFKANQLEMLLCFYFRLNFLEPIMELSGMYI